MPINQKKSVRSEAICLTELMAKTKTNHAIHPTLVTTYPVVRNEYAADLQAVITAEDLFAG